MEKQEDLKLSNSVFIKSPMNDRMDVELESGEIYLIGFNHD